MPDAIGAAAPAVNVHKVSKRYQAFALQDVSFRVEAGEAFGLLGLNGSGKSTLMRVMATLSPPSAGQVTIFGANVKTQAAAARRLLGMVSQVNTLDRQLTVLEVLRLHARLFGIRHQSGDSGPVAAAVERFGLSRVLGQTCGRLSGGMARRVMIARATLHAPKLLLMDEPTNGLDVEAREQLWSAVQDLRSSGVTLILTTHYLEEAERLCNRVAILHDGALIADEPIHELMSRLNGHTEIEIRWNVAVPGDLVERIRAHGDVEYLGNESVLLNTEATDEAIAYWVSLSRDLNLPIAGIAVARPSLQGVFKKLTGISGAVRSLGGG
jgi:ABC-2 type transport system ATP-binding protein